MAWRKGYELPKEIYKQTYWFIRSYPLLVEEYNNLIGKAHVMDGQPRGTDVGDPTGQIAVKAAELSFKIHAIDLAKSDIPPEYRDSVFDSIVKNKPCPDYASRNTWKTYRRRFIYSVAKIMGFS